METLEKTYWWHKGKLFLVEQLIKLLFKNSKKLKILEIGCGTGLITKALSKYGEVWGIEISKEAISACKEKEIKNIILGDINKIKIPKDFLNKFDLICCLDVLEHIQDDIKTSGYLLINVPAHKFLWSEHDEALHHKRRYSMREIVQKVIDCDFKIKKSSYFVLTFFPIIALYRLYTNLFTESTYPKTSYVMLPSKLNNLMTKVLEIEAKLIRRIDFPLGTTIIVIAQRY